ncbi:MAG: MFS transporter [Bacteroidales bacterium]|nr:MFS transporter [Bacteroidales bacterium]
MIYKNGRETSGIYVAGRVITAVYAGARLVWQAIRSCFGSGIWIDEYPWLDDDAWSDD